ncbi:MAG: TraR/DksA C4-type zinc finger protein [Thiogranum sp.]|jgi:RNA polymerase-binding protein DksA
MLNRDQINAFRETLKLRFRELREEIRQAMLQSDEQSYIELAGRVHDMEEASVADLLVDVSLADIDRHVEEIRDIDAALGRIATGTYGVCSDCGEGIEVARLEAYPTAKRCRPCQVIQESRQTAPRGGSL